MSSDDPLEDGERVSSQLMGMAHGSYHSDHGNDEARVFSGRFSAVACHMSSWDGTKECACAHPRAPLHVAAPQLEWLKGPARPGNLEERGGHSTPHRARQRDETAREIAAGSQSP